MNKKSEILLLAVMLTLTIFAGCGAQNTAKQKNDQTVTPQTTEVMTEEAVTEAVIPETEELLASTEAEKTMDDENEVPADGEYVACFNTDSTMFHVNEALEGKATLTVKDGLMTIHISLPSKSILHLYPGLAEDAQKEGAVLLDPTVDTVTYSDGLTEEVYGYDIPVPYLDREFDCALIGKKEKWYDHKVSVSLYVEEGEPIAQEEAVVPEEGSYTTQVLLEGGTGKAAVESPCQIQVKDGVAMATIVWSSKNYDYMMIGDEKYLPVNTEGNSTFEIPVSCFDQPMEVQADTVAMSTPHLIDYTLTFSSDLQKAE